MKKQGVRIWSSGLIRATTKRALPFLFVSALGVGVPAATAQRVYWLEPVVDKIQRAELDGSDIELLVATEEAIAGLALDVAAEQLYFGGSALRRAGLDGANITTIVSDRASGIALDVPGHRVYWTNNLDDVIRCANLDGTDVEELVTGVLNDPLGIALDVPGGKMYWAEISSHKIRRASLDGSDLEDLITIGLLAPGRIALDTSEGKMYWTESTGARLGRANLDGTDAEIILDHPVSGPRGIAIDVLAGKLYWVEITTGRIRRANLDGTQVEDIILGLENPVDIALDLSCHPSALDCQANGIPDDCEIVRGMVEDCNDNGVPDECDLAAGASQDCNSTGIPDECENDCNNNGLADECDIADGTSDDCNDNGIPDECETDCNGNGVADECDIDSGTSFDCTGNGIPDECETDCNGNGIGDTCDLLDGTSDDCTGNGVPDECEPDCNGNGVADSCDVADGTSEDCTGNGVPDECEPDCNGNGVADSCDFADPPGIVGPVSTDCNHNGVPDECDLADGAILPCAVIEFAPRGSTGPFVVRGNQMIIPVGGLQVEYEILVSGWGNAPGSPLLGAFNMVFEGSSSVLGANAEPPNPGVDLAAPEYIECTTAADCPSAVPPPVTQSGTCGHIFPGYCDDFGAAFYVVRVCSDNTFDVCLTDADCQPGGECIDNPRYVFPSTLNPWLLVYILGGNYFQWLGLPLNVELGAVDPDGVSKFLVGNLRLIVPDDARGTYTIRYLLGPDFTFVNDPETRLVPTAVVHGQLTIGGACCMPDRTCEFLLGSECGAIGGRFVYASCDDGNGDGIADVCGRPVKRVRLWRE